MVSFVGAQKRVLRVTGILGILVALVTVTADELSQYSPQGFASTFYFQNITSWRLLSGYLLGVLGIPLIAIGYWQVCQALKLSGIKRTRWMFWIITYGLALGAAAHATIIIIIVMVQQGIDSSLRALDILQTYVIIPFGLFFLCYLITSTWYFVVVLFRSTLYPKWMAFLNPFLLSIVIALLHVSNIVPIIDNYLAPAYLSIPHLLFFTLSTLVLWNPKKV
jgi:hypothetical protein